MVKLNGRHKSELRSLLELRVGQGLWHGVEPHDCDEDLAFYLRHGLVMHLGKGMGYVLTTAGRAALERSEVSPVHKPAVDSGESGDE